MGKRLGTKDYSDAKVQDALKDDVAFKSIKALPPARPQNERA
jgi:hypothetical protein